ARPRAAPARGPPAPPPTPPETGRSTPEVRVELSAEDSPRGLGRTLGKRVGGNPSRVRISYPPPASTRQNEGPRPGARSGPSSCPGSASGSAPGHCAEGGPAGAGGARRTVGHRLQNSRWVTPLGARHRVQVEPVEQLGAVLPEPLAPAQL